MKRKGHYNFLPFLRFFYCLKFVFFTMYSNKIVFSNVLCMVWHEKDLKRDVDGLHPLWYSLSFTVNTAAIYVAAFALLAPYFF